MKLISTDDISFLLEEGENLLDALERTGHQVEYQCRQGYCGSCRLKMDAGQVHYRDTPLAFVGKDEILPCCCVVESSLTLRVKLKNRQEDWLQDELCLLPKSSPSKG